MGGIIGGIGVVDGISGIISGMYGITETGIAGMDGISSGVMGSMVTSPVGSWVASGDQWDWWDH